MSPSFQFLTQRTGNTEQRYLGAAVKIVESIWRLDGTPEPLCLPFLETQFYFTWTMKNFSKKLSEEAKLPAFTNFPNQPPFHDWFWPLPPLAHTVFALCCIINPPIQISDSNAGPPLWQFFKESGRNMSHCLIQALALNNWVINHGWHYHCHFIIKRTMSNTSSACLSEHYQLFCLEQITSSIWASMCTSVKQGCSGRNLRLLRRQPWNRAPRQCLCPSCSSQKRALRPPACNPPKTVCWT